MSDVTEIMAKFLKKLGNIKKSMNQSFYIPWLIKYVEIIKVVKESKKANKKTTRCVTYCG